MSVSRSFRALELYDVLVNLVPGAVLLIAISVIFQIEKYVQFSTGAIAAGVFVVAAFVLGHFIQAVGSQLDGTPTLFADVIRVSKGEGVEEVAINITHVEESIWPLVKRKFSLPDDCEDHGEMFRLLLSYIDTIPATRALRFQVLHSFHRSMWAVWIIVFTFALASVLLKIVNLVAVRSWSVLAMAISGSFVGIIVFCLRKKKFNKRFVQYAIADFYSDQIDEVNDESGYRGS
jgi:hypothetical protein